MCINKGWDIKQNTNILKKQNNKKQYYVLSRYAKIMRHNIKKKKKQNQQKWEKTNKNVKLIIHNKCLNL